MDALRKVYHRTVQAPPDNVERLGQDLEAFETNLNRITAKKFMVNLSQAHMQARTVLRQLVDHVGGIYPPDSPEIFLPSLPKFDASERALVGKWKAYLKWKESNPLEIEEKDRSTLITRIQGVYRKAVIRMRYYTEI
jgi:cleavage stimulation factor subunit 3